MSRCVGDVTKFQTTDMQMRLSSIISLTGNVPTKNINDDRTMTLSALRNMARPRTIWKLIVASDVKNVKQSG